MKGRKRHYTNRVLCIVIIFCSALLQISCNTESVTGGGKSEVSEGSTSAEIDYKEGKEEIIYGTIFLNEKIGEIITNFNKTNDNYYITIKVYGVDRGLTRLNAEMLTDDCPDIIDFYSNKLYFEYAKNGQLVDLYTLMDIDNDDYFTEVWKAFEWDGGLYMMVPHFHINCWMASSVDIPEGRTWNYELFQELVEEKSNEKNIFANHTKMLLLRNLVQIIPMTDFAEEGTLLCQLLELCNNYGDRQALPDPTTGVLEWVQNTLFMELGMGSYSEYVANQILYDGNAVILGQPTLEGSYFELSTRQDCMGIPIRSQHKEGAWEFLQTLLQSEHQEKDWMGFPVAKTAWDVLADEYIGTEVRVGGSEKVTITKEDIQAMRDIVIQGNLAYNTYPEAVIEIVCVEADAYFYGSKTLEETADIIMNRVQIYLAE